MQERGSMTNMDRKVYLESLKKNPRFTEEMLQLVEKDLRYGLTLEETKEYTGKRFDYAQMKVCSECLRNDFEKEAVEVITDEALTGEQMAVLLEFYQKGVPLAVIKETAENAGQTAYAMRKLFRGILKKMEEAQKKEAAEKTELQEERYDALDKKIKELQTSERDARAQENFQAQLSEKDRMLESQQEQINRTRVEMIKLRGELDAEKKERHLLEEKLAETEQQKKEVGPVPDSITEKPAAKVEERDEKGTVAVLSEEYHAVLLDQDGRILRMIPVERMEKKKYSGIMTSLFSRLCLKRKIDIVRLVAERGLEPGQLIQIRSAIEKGLTDRQLMVLIDNELPAEQMEEIIHIAVYENRQRGTE